MVAVLRILSLGDSVAVGRLAVIVIPSDVYVFRAENRRQSGDTTVLVRRVDVRDVDEDCAGGDG